MNKKAALFCAIIQQLSYLQSGNDKKYKEIFSRALQFAEIHFDKKEDADFGSYIYLDFLETIGVIELTGGTNERRWVYLRSNFYHSFKGIQYKISSDEIDETANRLTLFSSNLDIFPLAYEVSEKEEWDSSSFLKTMSELSINYKEYKQDNLIHIGPFLDHYKFTEIYEPIFNKWQQVEKSDLDGLYRAGPQVFEKSFFIRKDSNFFLVKDDEWAYVFAQDLTSQGLISRRFFTESSLTIPWKFKLPSFVKRILMASSYRISFVRAGIEYSFNEQNAVDKYLRTLGFIKESA